MFFEALDGKLEPVKVSFYTADQAVKAGIFALVLAFLPNLISCGVVAFDVYVYGDPVD
ncbi:MAG: hypothetical protein IIV92_00305 [Schwartzia sp.]|nr:hypothetical protein [Schwartzia sp. (in: firmicutes)]